jgi:hypothetical protein
MPSPSWRPRASVIVWRADDGSGDTPNDILTRVIDRLRKENAIEGAREISLAITHCEEASMWIERLERRRRSA